EVVLNTVHHGLPEVRLESAFTSVFEGRKVSQCLQDGILHEILRVRKVSRPSRKATPGPFLERRQVSVQQSVERVNVSQPDAPEQLDRRFRINRHVHRRVLIEERLDYTAAAPTASPARSPVSSTVPIENAVHLVAIELTDFC